MNENGWFVIKDLDALINSTRALIFNHFGKDSNTDEDSISFVVNNKDQEELDSVLSFDESKNIILGIVKKQTHKISKKDRYLMSDELFADIVNALNDRMVSNILRNLVNKGLVETAYDSDADDFIFWIKDKQ